MPYSAGQVFLEVVPSFAGVQRAAERAAKPAGAAFSKGIDQGLRDADANVDRNAKRQAERYSGAFSKELQRRLKASIGNLGNAKILATVDDAEAKRELKSLRKELDRFTRLKIGADVDGASAIAQARALQARLHAISENSDLDFQVRINASQARQQLEQFASYARRSLGPTRDDLADAMQTNRIFNEQARQEARATAQARASAAREAARAERDAARDSANARRQADREVQDNYEQLIQRRASALRRATQESLDSTRRASQTGSDTDVAEATARIKAKYAAEAALARTAADKRIAAAGRALAGEAAAAAMGRQAVTEEYRDINEAARRSARERAELARLAATAERVQARSARQSALVQTGQTANAFRVFNGALLTAVTLGPLLIPVLAAMTGGFLALGTAIAGALLGVGVLFAGLAGVGKAVSALSGLDRQKRKSAKPPSSSDLRGVRDAQLALARAQEDAGQRIQSALDAQARAERGLTTAQRDAAKAQEALTQAREDAVKNIQDLQDALVGGALDERDATFAVQEAAAHLNVVLEDRQSTGREKDVAQLAYEQAVYNLDQIRKRNQRNSEELATANRQGVEGSQQVMDAKENLADATLAVGDAEKAVADASQDVTRARVEEARTLADAEQNVIDQQADLRNNVVRAGEDGTAAMDALNEAMGNLTPTGQAFARFLYGLKPLLDGIRGAAQDGLLPGLQSGIQLLVDTYGPDLISFVGTVAKLLGDLFDAASKTFTAPFWQDFFKTFAQFAPKFIELFFRVGMDVLTIIAGLAQAFAPFAVQLGDFLVKAFDAAANWATNLAGSDGFQKFLDYLRKEGPKLAGVVVALGTALVNLAIGLAPYADDLLDALLGFANWLASLDPDQIAKLAGVVLVFVGAIQALAGLASVVGSLAGLGQFLGLLTGGGAAAGAAGGVAAGAEVAGAGGVVAAGAASGPVGWIVLGVIAAIAAIVGLIFWIKHLWETNETFRDKVTAVWGFITGLFQGFASFWGTVFGPVNAFFRDVLGPTISWFWTDIISPVFNLIIGIFNIWWQIVTTVANIVFQIFTKILFPIFADWYNKHIYPIWENYIKPVFDALGNWISEHVAPAFAAGRDAIGRIWQGLIDLVKAPITFVVDTVINRGIIDTFNRLVDIFPGMTKVDHIQLPSGWNDSPAGRDNRAPGFASGGVLPGYTPGRDVHRFVSPTGGVLDLSGGEGIARPELVRIIGKKRWDAANAAARAGRADLGVGMLGGFADGGILGWLGQAANSVTDAIGSALGGVKRLMTDPLGALRSVVTTLLGGANSGIPGIAGGMALKGVDGVAAFISSMLGGDDAAPPAQGGTPGMGWKAMEAILSQAFPGLLFTSAFRPGAITAVGTRSYHALGRAVDMAPRMEVFNWLSKNFPDSRELFFSPAGPGRQILNGHMGANLAPVTVAQHYSHVHWAYQDGGVVPNIYDNGGFLPPGLSVVLNKTNKPEPVLTSQQFDQLGAGGGGGESNLFTGDIYGSDAEDILDEIERRKRNRRGAASLPAMSGGVIG